jgi:hypothetical protein
MCAQADLEASAAFGSVVGGDAAAHALDQRVAHGEPQARAFARGLGGRERLEQVI